MKLSFMKTVCALILCIVFSIEIYGFQSPEKAQDLKLMHKVQNGKLMLRWMPQNAETWQRGLEEGYILEKYLLPNNDSGMMQLVFKTKKPILPMEYDFWNDSIANEELLLLRDLIYIDRNDESWIEEHYPPDIYSEAKKQKSRFLFSNFIQNNNFDYTLLAGLGYMDESFSAGRKYLFRLYLSGTPSEEAVEQVVMPSGFEEAPLPELVCEPGSEQMKFAWNTRYFADNYYGYTLSWSEDGIHFQSMTEAPFFNIYDHLDTIDLFDNFYHNWSWPKKDTTYWFRLHGADYFGGMSEQFSVCSGFGYDPVAFSPAITKTIQTDSNYATIQWKLEAEFEQLVKEFQVFRADSMDGIYRPVLTGIRPPERSISVKMKHLTNYYRIVAVPFNGPKVASFPTLVMGLDEIPPACPENFEAVIDSAGVVRFSWNTNTEPDLYGYILYKSYVKSADFARITAKPIKATSFVDSVNMQSGNELVFYKLQAVDKVNNRSSFTDILEVKKPDVFPPAEPHIHSVKKFPDHIELRWHESGSKDVVLHQLFRKEINVDEGWTLLKAYDAGNDETIFRDSFVQNDRQYAYTLLAIDDDGLKSDYAQIATGSLVDFKLLPDIEDVEIIYVPDDKKVRIDWRYETGKTCHMLVYKGQDISRMSKMNSVPETLGSVKDGQVRPDHAYVYLLRAECDDGTRSPFSEKLEITIPK